MLRSQSVIDRHDHTITRICERMAQMVVSVEVSQHPSAAVEENQRGLRHARYVTLGRPVDSERNLDSRCGPGDQSILDLRNRFRIAFQPHGERAQLINVFLFPRRKRRGRALLKKSLRLWIKWHNSNSGNG